MSDRRAFLRSLAALPLVGGSVAILGQPTAAAVPVTGALLEAYNEWLDLERSWLMFERYGQHASADDDPRRPHVVWRNRQTGECWTSTAASSVSGVDHRAPASRAAVVLAAAGVDLTKGRRL